MELTISALIRISIGVVPEYRPPHIIHFQGTLQKPSFNNRLFQRAPLSKDAFWKGTPYNARICMGLSHMAVKPIIKSCFLLRTRFLVNHLPVVE